MPRFDTLLVLPLNFYKKELPLYFMLSCIYFIDFVYNLPFDKFISFTLHQILAYSI